MQIKKEIITCKPVKMIHPIDRSWQDVFCNTLNLLGFTRYAMPEDRDVLVFNEGANGYICKDYIIRTYSHSASDCNFNSFPNFEHIPSGFKMSWHKYPLRSARANQNLSFVEFMKMLGWKRG